MEAIISQLQKDFKTQIENLSTLTHAPSSIDVLTKEELSALEKLWIELKLWKKEHKN